MSEFIKDDYFKIDPEPHIIGNMELVNHFPGVQMWWRAIENIHRPMITGMPLSVYEGMEEWEMTENHRSLPSCSEPWTNTGSISPACCPNP
jgi:uncharacterized protein